MGPGPAIGPRDRSSVSAEASAGLRGGGPSLRILAACRKDRERHGLDPCRAAAGVAGGHRAHGERGSRARASAGGGGARTPLSGSGAESTRRAGPGRFVRAAGCRGSGPVNRGGDGRRVPGAVPRPRRCLPGALDPLQDQADGPRAGVRHQAGCAPCRARGHETAALHGRQGVGGAGNGARPDLDAEAGLDMTAWQLMPTTVVAMNPCRRPWNRRGAGGGRNDGWSRQGPQTPPAAGDPLKPPDRARLSTDSHQLRSLGIEASGFHVPFGTLLHNPQKFTPAACQRQRRYRGIRQEYRLVPPRSQGDCCCDCRVRSNSAA